MHLVYPDDSGTTAYSQFVKFDAVIFPHGRSAAHYDGHPKSAADPPNDAKAKGKTAQGEPAESRTRRFCVCGLRAGRKFPVPVVLDPWITYPIGQKSLDSGEICK